MTLPTYPGAEAVLKAARPSPTFLDEIESGITDALDLTRQCSMRLDRQYIEREAEWHPTDPTQIVLRRYRDAWRALKDQLQDCQERLLILRGDNDPKGDL